LILPEGLRSKISQEAVYLLQSTRYFVYRFIELEYPLPRKCQFRHFWTHL